MENVPKVIIFISLSILLQIEAQIQEDKFLPEKCEPKRELLYRHCCIFPPFFSHEIARSCGSLTSLMWVNEELNVTGFRRRMTTNCEYWDCLLSKYYILNEDRSVDEDKYFTHLDKWVELNPEFGKVMVPAKMECKQSYRFYMPLTTCEFYNFHTCIRNYMNVNCPRYLLTPKCLELKEFYAECREYFQI